jgi:hypothetical protein
LIISDEGGVAEGTTRRWASSKVEGSEWWLGFSAAAECFGEKILFATAPSFSMLAPWISKAAFSDYKMPLGHQKILGRLLVKHDLNLCPYLKHAAHLSADLQ